MALRFGVLLLAACDGGRFALPQGEHIGTLWLSAMDREEERRVDARLELVPFLTREPVEGIEASRMDACEVSDLGGGAIGGRLPFLSGLERAWLYAAGEHYADLETQLWRLEGADLLGRVVGIGWQPREREEELPAFDQPRVLAIPPALAVTEPALGAPVPLSDDLVVRWTGDSVGAIRIWLPARERSVGCWARDDGRFVVPAEHLAMLGGPPSLTVTRVLRRYPEVEPERFLWVNFTDSVRVVVAAEEP